MHHYSDDRRNAFMVAALTADHIDGSIGRPRSTRSIESCTPGPARPEFAGVVSVRARMHVIDSAGATSSSDPSGERATCSSAVQCRPARPDADGICMYRRMHARTAGHSTYELESSVTADGSDPRPARTILQYNTKKINVDGSINRVLIYVKIINTHMGRRWRGYGTYG